MHPLHNYNYTQDVIDNVAIVNKVRAADGTSQMFEPLPGACMLYHVFPASHFKESLLLIKVALPFVDAFTNLCHAACWLSGACPGWEVAVMAVRKLVGCRSLLTMTSHHWVAYLTRMGRQMYLVITCRVRRALPGSRIEQLLSVARLKSWTQFSCSSVAGLKHSTLQFWVAFEMWTCFVVCLLELSQWGYIMQS